MKNLLNYYYHIIINDDVVNECFEYHNDHFYILEYQRSINEVQALVSINQDFINHGLFVNQIIFNIYNEPLTFYQNKYYYLLLVKEQGISKYHYVEAIINNDNKILLRNNWDYLWSSKIDYIEYQLNYLENTYPLINESINYYIGLTENAISYFKKIKKDGIKLYYNHRRITNKHLLDPFEIIIDYKVRDIAEYIKEIFINENKNINEILKIVSNCNFNYLDYLLFYCRMLYPSFYFDLYERVVNENIDECIINKTINRINDYELLIYRIYSMINNQYSMIGIDWINRKFV